MQAASSKIVRYVIFFMVAAATIYFLYRVREVVLTFSLGALLAYLLFRPLQALEKRGIKRIWAILLLYLLAAAIFSLSVYYAVPAAVREIRQLAEMYPQYAREAEQLGQQLQGISGLNDGIDQLLQNNVQKVESTIYGALDNFLAGIYSLLGKVLALVFSPILAFYMVNDWEKIRDGFLGMLSPSGRRQFKDLMLQIDSVLIEFLKGHLLVATFVGVLVGASAYLLDVKFPLLLGVLSGVTNLIPYFGPFLGGIPAVVIAFSESARLALYMGLAILLIQQVESNLITPRIMGGKLGLHPLVIIFALLAGGKLLGIWGMLFAVPLTAVLKVVLHRVYMKAMED